MTQEEVVAVQQRLNDAGYGPVATDGVLGQETRLALQTLCTEKQLAVAEPQLAPTLVKLVMQLEATTSAEPVATAIETKQTPEPPPAVSQAKAETATAVEEGITYYQWTAPEESEGDDAQSGDDSSSGSAEEQTEPTEEEKQIQEQQKAFETIGKALDGLSLGPYPNQSTYTAAVDYYLTAQEVEYRDQLDAILTQSKITPNNASTPVALEASGCGCSRDFSQMIYGFYPYWNAQPDVTQKIDFSLYDRIGFYSLLLDGEGDIEQQQQWSDDLSAAGFIKMAHKYRVEVDLTITASGWQGWDNQALSRAVSNATKLITQSFTPKQPTGLASVTTLVSSSKPVQGDGVTVVFASYGTALDRQRNVADFVDQLHQQLIASGGDFKLNLVLDMDPLAHDTSTAFSGLRKILLKNGSDPALVDTLMVFLPEPTSDAKKALRRMIEDQFHGAERQQVMRKVVPIISPLGHQNDARGPFSQFVDDLIYLEDNFGGAALWPLSLVDDPGADTVSEQIISVYNNEAGKSLFGRMVNTHMPQLCEFACPNRWLFRIVFDALAGVLVLYAILAFWYFRLRRFYSRYSLYFASAGLATILIFFTSMVCDPFWQDKVDLVAISTILAIIASMIGKYIYKAKQPPLP